MIKGITTSAQGMQPRMTQMEIISNNLANITTTGYKRENVFMQMIQENGVDAAEGKGSLAEGNVQTTTDLSEGSMQMTGNPLDFAISGNAFFVVSTPRGLRYTKNGKFSLAADGTIVTSQGYPVMGTRGTLRLPDVQRLPQKDLTADEEGNIQIDKTQIGQLELMTFDDASSLQQDGSSMFVSTTAGHAANVGETTAMVKQGYLEESNVDGIHEMVAMIELNRNFEAGQKAIEAQDTSLGQTMEIGKLS